MSAGQHSPGRVGRYILEHRVASGGMGEVFSARAVGAAGTSKRVCIKRILASRKLSEDAIAHFISEAKLSMQLSHANVVPVFDFGRAEDGYYLVMEWVDGVDFGAVLEACVKAKQPLTVAEVSYVGARLAHGLAHAHSRSIVHRDVKPANLLLSREGQVHLTDFGVAMLSGADLPAAGTPAYMAPEQRFGLDVDARADVFAMGVTLYHLATCELSRDPERVRENAPAPFRELLARMVAHDVDGRPADMEEVARELERLESVSVAGGAELPRVSLQRRVADLRPAATEGPSLELVFLTAASLVIPPGTLTTASAPSDVLEQGRVPDPASTLGEDASGAGSDARAKGTGFGSAATMPADGAPLDGGRAPVAPPAARGGTVDVFTEFPARPGHEAGTASLERPPHEAPHAVAGSGLRRAARLGIGLAAVAMLGGLGYESWGALSASPPAASSQTSTLPGPASGAQPAPAQPVLPAPTAPTPALGSLPLEPAAAPESPRDSSADTPSTGSAAVSATGPAVVAATARARPEQATRHAATTPERPTSRPPPGTAASPAETEAPAAEPSARLHVGARPWAEVYVDGRRVGQTPISALPLPPGLHHVRLVNGPLDAQRTIDVRLAPGETRYIREDME
ncbi:MAG: protein kinase [Myxococcales bacterium]|nr:protein kinase [Myxococcales bacterium]